jgi:hypothetical protein
MGPIADLDNTLTELDGTLDTVDQLIQALPISNINKRALASRVYDLWVAVENIVDIEVSLDSTN